MTPMTARFLPLLYTLPNPRWIGEQSKSINSFPTVLAVGPEGYSKVNKAVTSNNALKKDQSTSAVTMTAFNLNALNAVGSFP